LGLVSAAEPCGPGVTRGSKGADGDCLTKASGQLRKEPGDQPREGSKRQAFGSVEMLLMATITWQQELLGYQTEDFKQFDFAVVNYQRFSSQVHEVLILPAMHSRPHCEKLPQLERTVGGHCSAISKHDNGRALEPSRKQSHSGN